MGYETTQPVRSLLHQTGDIDPERIALHFDRLVKLKGLVVEVEPQPAKRFGIAVEKFRGLAAHHTIQRGDTLLSIEQELHYASGQWSITTGRGSAGIGGPDKQAADWTTKVE